MSEFRAAILRHQSAFGLELPAEKIDRLGEYYDLIQEHNPLLHLVGPCSAEEFAIRHILESLTLLKHLPQKVKFADVGAGAGLPSIPCLLIRGDLLATMIESKEKKAAFLNEAAGNLGIEKRVEIVARQFEETLPTGCEFVTCRALDRFTARLPKLLKWSGRRRLLLFGGPSLGEELKKQKVSFSEALMPMSRQRFLFVSDPS
jgi:16S rRNA (guanine527-N7)-methyltransferase